MSDEGGRRGVEYTARPVEESIQEGRLVSLGGSVLGGVEKRVQKCMNPQSQIGQLSVKNPSDAVTKASKARSHDTYKRKP